MKHFELTPDESYGRNLAQALQKIQAEAERNGVPRGLQPELHMDANLATTYRWEWEEDEDGSTAPNEGPYRGMRESKTPDTSASLYAQERSARAWAARHLHGDPGDPS
jgi:hypothetical protein